MHGVRLCMHKFPQQLCSRMLHNDRAEIASVFVSERPPGEYQQSANGPNFYFSRHFLTLPPPPVGPRAIPSDYTAERRQISRISSLRSPFTCERAFTRYRYEESVNAWECVYHWPDTHTRSSAFTPAGPRVLPCGAVIIIWTATSGRIWCSGVACWANRATMSSPRRTS